MPRYRITSPDGRKVTISGDHEPSQEEASAIFASLPDAAAAPSAQTPPDPARYAAREAKLAQNVNAVDPRLGGGMGEDVGPGLEGVIRGGVDAAKAAVNPMAYARGAVGAAKALYKGATNPSGLLGDFIAAGRALREKASTAEGRGELVGGGVVSAALPGVLAKGAGAVMTKVAPMLSRSGAARAVALTEGATADAASAAGASAAAKAGPGMAERMYEKALAPTGAAKIEAPEVIPGLLERRVSGNLRKIERKATAELEDIGPKIKERYEAAAGKRFTGDPENPTRTAIEPIYTQPLVDAVEELKAPFRTPKPTTDMRLPKEYVDLNPAAVSALDEIQTALRGLGETTDAVVLHKYRQALDQMVEQSGGFTRPLPAGSAAAIGKGVRNEFRKVLNDAVEGIGDLNADYSFWSGVKDVVRATQTRQVGQEGLSLSLIARGGIGAKAGATVGTVLGVGPVVGGGVGAALGAFTKTPVFRTFSAVQLDKLAGLMAGDAGVLKTVAGRQVATVLALNGIRVAVDRGQGNPSKTIDYSEVQRIARETGMSDVALGEALKAKGYNITHPSFRSGGATRPTENQ